MAKKNVLMLLGAFLFTTLSAQVNLISNLKVCMPFNGNANDLSGNGNNGVVSGSVSLTSDRFNNANKAYRFTGATTDYIAISSFSNIAVNNELTFSIWAKNTVITSSCLFMLNPDNFNDRCVGCAQYSGVGLLLDYGDVPSGGRITQSASNDSLWHHYVYVISQAQNKKEIYMDGALKASGTCSTVLASRNFPLYIGAGTSSGGGGSLRWIGKIDDIMIYNRALNANEVNALYNTTITCTANTVGTEELMENLQRHYFYPSFSNGGKFYYTGSLAQLDKIEVLSIDGKRLREYNNPAENTTLEFGPLPAGIYFIKSERGGQETYQKILIQN